MPRRATRLSPRENDLHREPVWYNTDMNKKELLKKLYKQKYKRIKPAPILGHVKIEPAKLTPKQEAKFAKDFEKWKKEYPTVVDEGETVCYGTDTV